MKTTFTAPGISATLARRPRAEDELCEALSEMMDGAARPRQASPPRTRIAWRALAEATFTLDDASQWEGELPEGMAQQAFRACLQTAARALGGRVGIRIRRRQWACWAERRPEARLDGKPRGRPANPEVWRVMKERGCSRQWAHRILKREAGIA